jgi:2-methylcitrate dehydratase PrpD
MSQRAIEDKDEDGGVGDRLIEFVQYFSWTNAPKAVVDNAKLAILDCLGASLLASTRETGKAVKSFAARHGASGPCTGWGVASKTSARDAAFLNGTLAHGLDYDDRNHSSTYSLATAIAAAEECDGTGAEVLDAFIVAREVRGAFDAIFASRGEGVGPGANGWHSNGILGPIASVCAAAKICKDPPDIVRQAIGLAAGSCGALTRDGGTLAKPFRTGHAAATGLTCLYLAQCGFTADVSAIDGERGLLDALGSIPQEMRRRLGHELGVEFDLAKPIRGKRYASCSATHVGIEAMLRLRAEHPFHADDIETVTCDLKPFPLLRSWPGRGFEARFSMPFCLATAALGGALTVDDFNDTAIENPDVLKLMQRIKHTPKAPNLCVTLKSGERLEEPLRKPSNLSSRAEIEAKFRSCAAGILDGAAIESLVAMVADLQSLDRIRQLTRVLLPR